jgi:hypothetical protein
MVLQTMTGAPWRSAAVSALFAVHPLHIESVAWISERKDVLSTFFMLLTLLAYVRYTRRPSCRTYLPVVIGFALGLLAKPMVVTLPFILLLMDYWPLKRFGHDTGSIPQTEGKSPTKTIGQLLYEKLPLFGLTILSIIVTLSAQRAEIITMQYLPLSFRMSNALVSYGEYLTKTIWPLPLAVLYLTRNGSSSGRQSGLPLHWRSSQQRWSGRPEAIPISWSGGSGISGHSFPSSESSRSACKRWPIVIPISP